MKLDAGVIYRDGKLVPINGVMDDYMQEVFVEGEAYAIDIKKLTPKKKRTLLQNAAIRLFAKWISIGLNDRGLDMKKVFEVKQVEVPWHPDTAYEVFWRQTQIAATGKQSSTQLDTADVSVVSEAISRQLATHLGVVVNFPDRKWQGYE